MIELYRPCGKCAGRGCNDCGQSGQRARSPDTFKFADISVLSSGAQPTKSDGGPSSYYDFLPGWVTLNDMMEWLAQNRWGAYSLHLKDAMKACMRFGAKEGTPAGYDAKKLVYSGLRLLMMVENKTSVAAFLRKLADDIQFKE